MFVECTLQDPRVNNIRPNLEYIMTYASIRNLDLDAINRALQVVFMVHSGQARIGESMIEHIVKVTRNTCYFLSQHQTRCGGTDTALDSVTETAYVVGTLLHDSVEDALERVISMLSGRDVSSKYKRTEEIQYAREEAYRLISEEFGGLATETVRLVTNPHWDKQVFSQRVRFGKYRDKIEELIKEAPFFASLLKLGDNYVNLDFEPGSTGADGMIRKYGPVCKLWIQFLNSPEAIRSINDDVREQIIAHYELVEDWWLASQKSA